MGYYDDHDFSRTIERKKQKRQVLTSAILGAVIGGFIVVFSIPFLANADILPYTLEKQEQTNQPPQGQNENITSGETINVHINSDIITAVDHVSDAVVGVINMQQGNIFSPEGSEGTGSGVIYKKVDGRAFVVTNHHVIDRANAIEVRLTDGTRIPAKLLGTDIITDLAVLEIDAEQIETVAEFGNSDNLRVGEPAIAIGNPLGLRFSSSVTQGIISATERSIPVDLNGDGQVDWHAEVLQTDAAINPGNSGGALVNIEGKVIGINSMKIAQSAVEGIGFAIPASIAIPIIEDIETYGEVRRPQLGVGIRSLNEIPSYHWEETLKLPKEVKAGVVVTSVSPMSAADRAGLEQYDVIVAINDKEVEDGYDLRKYLYTEQKIGDTVELTIYREGKREQRTVELAEADSF